MSNAPFTIGQRFVHACLYFSVAAQTAAASTACIAPWQLRAGTSLDDEIHAALRDGVGNVYLGGFENGLLGVRNDWPVGDVRGFVEKHSPDGGMVWRRTFDTVGIDAVETMALDPDRHRLVVAGRTDAVVSGSNHGQFDLFVAALDIDSSSVLAVGQFGDRYPQHPRKIVTLPSGHIVVVGSDDTFVESNTVLGQETMFATGLMADPQHPGLFKQSWWRQPNEPGALTPVSRGFALTPAGDGTDDVIVAWTSTASAAGSQLERLDASGASAWARPISTSAFGLVLDAATSRSGRLYVAGLAGGALAGPPLGSSDGFVMEIDPASGNTRWGRQFGSPTADTLMSLSISDAGTLFVAGWTEGIVVPGGIEAPQSLYALTFSDSGATRSGWQQSLSSPVDFVDALAIVPACDRTALLAGHATGHLAGLPSLGKTDTVVISALLDDSSDAIFASTFE